MSQSNQIDVGRQRLGAVYAKALLGVTEAKGNTAAVLDELDAFIDQLLPKVPQFDLKLAAPRVPPEQKNVLLDKALKGRVSGELLNFLKVVCQHGRFDCLREIRGEARRLFHELQKQIEVRLVTAQAVEPDLVQQVSAKLAATLGRQVVVRHEVDEKLIGGLMVRVGDTVYDGSVANRLARLRVEAVERAEQSIRESLHKFVTS